MFSKKVIGNGLKICSIILGMTVLKDEKIVLVLNVQEKSCQVCSWLVGGCKSRFKDSIQQLQRKRRKITEHDDVLLKYWFKMSI